MPATMMHLLAAHALVPEGSDAYFLGSILPDCLDSDRALKDHLHLRDIPPEERLPALIRLGEELDLARDFDFGVLFHLYLDYLWDNGPQADHRRAYKGETWFRDYRRELAMAGSRGAQRMPWAKPLWERLYAAPPEAHKNSLGLPEDEIAKFMDFNYHWHTEEVLPESAIFTDALVDGFTARALREFRAFLAAHFPGVAEMHIPA